MVFVKYAKYICTADAVVLEPLNGSDFKEVCLNTNNSAGGLDHFTHSPFRLGATLARRANNKH